MKKILLFTFVLSVGLKAQAQEFPADLGDNPRYNTNNTIPTFTHNFSDPSFDMAAGIQYLYPFTVLSFKYAITEHSVVQGLISPFATGYAHYNYAFYGAKNIYRLPFNNCSYYGPFTVSYPYLFIGGGLMNVSYPVYDVNGVYAHNTTTPNPAYFLGAGYELIVGKHLGFSAELSFGNVTAKGATAQNGITLGGGFHYYFCCCHGTPKIATDEQADDMNTNEQEQPAASEENTNEDHPAKRARKQRVRRDNDDE